MEHTKRCRRGTKLGSTGDCGPGEMTHLVSCNLVDTSFEPVDVRVRPSRWSHRDSSRITTGKEYWVVKKVEVCGCGQLCQCRSCRHGCRPVTTLWEDVTTIDIDERLKT